MRRIHLVHTLIVTLLPISADRADNTQAAIANLHNLTHATRAGFLDTY